MVVTASQLRADIYNLLDRVIETGEPIEIERKGKVLRIVPPSDGHWLDRIPRENIIIGDPEDLVSMDWSSYWNPDFPEAD